MLRVLHVVKCTDIGATERYIISMAERLHGKKCEFFLVYSENGPLVDSMRELGIEVSRIPMRNKLDIKAAYDVKKYCKDNSIDVVHTHFPCESFISIIAKVLGSRVILVTSNHLINKSNILARVINKMLTFWVDRMIAGSSAVKEQMFAEGVRKEKVHVIHGGIDADSWKGRKNLKIRNELGLNKEDFVVACITNFGENEGQIFLMESVKALNRIAQAGKITSSRKIKFVIVGDGFIAEECKTMAQMMGVADDIVFTGFVDDVKSILKCSDLYVMPNDKDAMAIPVLEALACDLPVVAMDSGSPTDIITPQNCCGLLIEGEDIGGLANAVIKFATDENFYFRCSSNAFRIVKEKFNIDKNVEETYNVYIRSLSAGHG